MNNNYQKETQTKLTKGLLDMIVLEYLSEESMHGYQMITKIRRGFGVYLGPSTVYPLLGLLEKKGYRVECLEYVYCKAEKDVQAYC